MTKDEYIKALEQLDQQRQELQKRFIESNTTIKPGQVVRVDDKFVWLRGYRVVQHYVVPMFRKLTKTYKPTSMAALVRDYSTMRELTADEREMIKG